MQPEESQMSRMAETIQKFEDLLLKQQSKPNGTSFHILLPVLLIKNSLVVNTPRSDICQSSG
jgi:hypothetical protein